jgi:Cu+-exporting ATPase
MDLRILKDPVCGMTVTEKSFYHLERQGQTHYFCGPNCKARFAAHGLRPTEASAAASGMLAKLLEAVRWRHSQ